MTINELQFVQQAIVAKMQSMLNEMASLLETPNAKSTENVEKKPTEVKETKAKN